MIRLALCEDYKFLKGVEEDAAQLFRAYDLDFLAEENAPDETMNELHALYRDEQFWGVSGYSRVAMRLWLER